MPEIRNMKKKLKQTKIIVILNNQHSFLYLLLILLKSCSLPSAIKSNKYSLQPPK